MRAPNHLNALRALEAAARHLSYVRAAEELNVTPAAVGQLIRGLEGALGVTLFHRSQSGAARLQLTPEARSAIPDLQAGFDLLQVAVERLKASVARAAITITMPPSLADKWLLGRVERFQSRYPQYDLVVDTNVRIVDFNTERIDLGLRYGGGRWPGLAATYLMSDEFFPVCSPALLTGAHPLRSADDLRHHALIHDASPTPGSGFPTWRSWLAWAGVNNKAINAERGLQVNDSAAVIQASIAGGGVALGRSVLVANDLAAGRLVRPFGAALPYPLAYYIVHKDGQAPSPAVQALIAWLQAEAAADKAADTGQSPSAPAARA